MRVLFAKPSFPFDAVLKPVLFLHTAEGFLCLQTGIYGVMRPTGRLWYLWMKKCHHSQALQFPSFLITVRKKKTDWHFELSHNYETFLKFSTQSFCYFLSLLKTQNELLKEGFVSLQIDTQSWLIFIDRYWESKQS